MVQASGSPAANAPGTAPPLADWSWKRWLLLGVCGGVAFGITHRLLSLQLEVPWRNTQPFGVKATPGTSLDALRQRFGGDARAIRGDLELIELEQQRKREEAARTEQMNKLEAQDRLDRERQQRELDQAGQTNQPELPPETTAPPTESQRSEPTQTAPLQPLPPPPVQP